MENSKRSRLFSRMYFIQWLFLTALFSLVTMSGYAQSKTVTGKIIDSTGEPVIGASVLVKGTTNGVISDIDGNFSIQGVANDAVLQISFVGYKAQDISVAGKTRIDVTLVEDTEMLDEVVVVGYGVQKKSDVTGALASVSSEELNTKPVSNAFEALQGKAAGVDITSSQRPGELGDIRIRGNRSLNASNSPLYVVDGVPLNSGGIETINPRDIESIDILKDASSTAIYGSRGANGVILITTKRGKTGALTLNYSGSVTIENLVDKSPAMSASDYITWRRWAYYNANPSTNPMGNQPDYDRDQDYFSGDAAALANVNKGWVNGTWDGSKVTDTDWGGMVTQTGITHEHTLSASGGTENMQGFFSFGYLNNEGTQKGQEYERYNMAMSVDLQAKPWFKMGGSINAAWSVQDYGYSRTGQSSGSGPTDIYGAAKAIPRYTVPYDENGDIILNPGGSVTNVYTVVDEWTKSNDNRQTFRALGSFYAQVDFGKIWEPLDGLSYKFAFGPDFRHYRKGIFIDSSSAVRAGGSNYASWASERHFSWTLDNMIMYNKTFGEHSLGVTLLQSASKYNREGGSMSEQNVLIPEFLWNNMGLIDITNTKYAASMGTSLSENQLASYMARVNYSFKDRYLLTVSGRYDGSSVLAEGNKWDFFPSAALGWRIDQEDFMSDISWINQLKLRFGMGTTGNAAVSAYGTLGAIGAYWMPFSTGNTMIFVTNEPYYSSSQNLMPNKDLGWEKTTQYNYGIDFSFLNGRVGGTVDIYHSRTSDLLMRMTIPSLSGYPAMMANIGQTKNFGVDMTLNFVPVRTKNFEWVSDLNLAYQKDEIVELSSTEAVNDWDFWVYPAQVEIAGGDVYTTDTLDTKALAVLQEGGKVLITAGRNVTYGREVQQYFTPVFWNTSWFKMRPPHTTGIFLNEYHPLFREFPTEYHSNLQWWELLNRAPVMQFTDFPDGFQPLVQSIDTWFVSRKIGVLFEVKVLNGRLMMTTLDLTSRLDERMVARQLRKAVYDYMNSDAFRPAFTVSPEQIGELFTKEAGAVNSYTKDLPDELKPKKVF